MKTGFPPIANQNSTTLVLGSMPGEESLCKQQYYAHPRNAFWYIMGELFNFDLKINYKAKTKCLLNNNVAVWDVLKSCDRVGSLDSSIKNNSIIVNDFHVFFREHYKINKVYFNGAKAEQEYKKRVLPTLNIIQSIEYVRLPSTSPAMAKSTKEEKLIEWKIIKNNI